LRECSEQLGHLVAERPDEGADDVDVRWELPSDALPVAIDRQMLRRVMVNLVRNAVEAVRNARPPVSEDAPRGHVVVRAEATSDGVSIIVEDDGPGVPEPARERIFDPYFTTKSEGTGLGLAIVKKIVVEHNGSIRVTRGARLDGAALVLTLPLPHSLAIAVARDPAPAA
jgi:signal transduction histidine kinase